MTDDDEPETLEVLTAAQYDWLKYAKLQTYERGFTTRGSLPSLRQLEQRGLIESHPNVAPGWKVWRITEAGEAYLGSMGMVERAVRNTKRRRY